VYAVCGEALAQLGRHAEAARYLRRSLVLDASAGRAGLARALAASGRPWEALSWLVQAAAVRALMAEEAAAAAEVADELGLASLQAEIDRVRLAAAEVRPRLGFLDGPFTLPDQARLSTGAPIDLMDNARDTLLYLAEPSCRTCTADLEAIARLTASGRRVVVWSATEDDRTLRQTLKLYQREWPVVVGPGGSALLGVEAPAALLVGRQGWSAGVARPPLPTTLPALLSVYAQGVESTAAPGFGRGAASHGRREPGAGGRFPGAGGVRQGRACVCARPLWGGPDPDRGSGRS
jgi:hypothetical protein